MTSSMGIYKLKILKFMTSVTMELLNIRYQKTGRIMKYITVHLDFFLNKHKPCSSGQMPAQKLRANPVPGVIFSNLMPKIDFYYFYRFTVKRVFFGISEKIPKITIFRIFWKNFQPYGFFTAQLRTHELLVNNKGNHNESRFGVVA